MRTYLHSSIIKNGFKWVNKYALPAVPLSALQTAAIFYKILIFHFSLRFKCILLVFWIPATQASSCFVVSINLHSCLHSTIRLYTVGPYSLVRTDASLLSTQLISNFFLMEFLFPFAFVLFM